MIALHEVTTLYEKNARDIPGMLRESADTIEREQHVVAMTAVALHDDGTVSVYGWGDTDNLRSIAHLHLGLQQATAMALGADE